MEMQNLKSLYVEQLRDLYSAESQLCEALPKMAKAASHNELRKSFEMHLEQTKKQREDVKSIIEKLGAQAEGHECKAMKGLIAEGEELLEMQGKADADVLDAGLIAAAQRVEHYEIAGYGTVCTYAKTLGETDAAKILHRIAGEEGETDKKLTTLAESVVNPAAI
jgi:ferritin-like metal-binding protein YciE